MSKRTDRIRALFTAPQTSDELSADNDAAPSRVSSGSVRSLKDSFSNVERENDNLRQQLASGIVVMEVDPNLVDPSPVRDRFKDQDVASFDALKASIERRGQRVPVLLRQHPNIPGRYQSAYGHRRVRAARELGRTVKAVISDLSDEDLVVAQGVENSEREDLSFIERAVFSMHLEDVGHSRSVIQEALSIDRAEVSKLLAVARSVPADLIENVGRAPKVGRPRWQSLSDLLKQKSALKAARDATVRPEFRDLDSDRRFLSVFLAASRGSQAPDAPKRLVETVHATTGEKIARVQREDLEIKVTFDRRTNSDFASFLVDQLPRLFETYVASKASESSEA